MDEMLNYKFSRPAPSERLWPLEASAGTGKTWTIENFVADYLADGKISPDEVVIVTFTKAAAAELRSRIRENISSIVNGDNAESPRGKYDPEEQRVLRRVLGNFGQIRISTIHGFAQRSLSILGEPLREVTAEVDTDQFRKSVLADVIRSLETDELIELGAVSGHFKKLVSILKVAAANPGGTLIASASSDSSDVLLSVARKALEAIRVRKSQLSLLGYDDLLTKLSQRLESPEAANALASSIKVLLIDEFQDTDSLQWKIFRKIEEQKQLKAFVVVGDPKQAIYGFRGGDVQVYREAVSAESANFLLGNRRSSQSFLAAANEFFENENFGFVAGGEDEPLPITDEFVAKSVEISYQPMVAAGSLKDVVDGPSWLFRSVAGGTAAEVQRNIQAELPGYIAGLVKSGTIIDPATQVRRKIEFSDICVLANSNPLIASFTKALHDANIPATILGGGNVFVSDAAAQWQYLLEAVSRPSRLSSARLLAWSWFGGQSIESLAEHRDNEQWLSTRHDLLYKWHQLFEVGDRQHFYQQVIEESGVLQFLAGMDNAERHITDVLHIAEILRERSSDSLDGLVELLVETHENASDSNDDADAVGGQWSRRIDGDRKTVQLMTIHKSKGLQFPIVLLPYLSDNPGPGTSEMAYRAYRGDEGHTLIDITAKDGSPGAMMKSLLNTSEQKRKAYVALTRGQVLNVLWTWNLKSSMPVIRDHQWRERQANENKNFGWDTTELASVPKSGDDERSRSLATMSRILETPLARLSYSGITKYLQVVTDDDSMPDSEPEGSDGSTANLPMVPKTEVSRLRGSALLGKVVHKVLQTIDLTANDDRETIAQSVQDAAAEFGLSLDGSDDDNFSVSSSSVVELVESSLKGSLGDLAPGMTLADFGTGRRLPEMGFDLTLRDGVSIGSLMRVIREHLGGDVLFATWLDQLRVDDRELKGFLSGSLDAVLAAGDPESPRFFVVDYKTNRLQGDGPTGYNQGVMAKSMVQHHYFLQGLIYLVALHRYLRSRIGSTYTYENFVNGAGYLFLRGMRSDYPGAGVVHLQPSAACIEALSDLFDGVNDAAA